MASIISTLGAKNAAPVIKATNGRAPSGSHAYTGLSSGHVPRSASGTAFVKGGTQRQNPNAHGEQGSKIKTSL
jgi:hypothetical protein